MARWTRWLLLLGVFVSFLGVLVRRHSAQRTPPSGLDPVDAQWPPFEPAWEPPAATATAWVEPVEGACPTTHPVKTNATSGIFHVPGGRFYERTKPQRCYSTPEAAATDGYRPAKA